MILSPKKVEIFCGTGGVGKTTIATGRALNLALSGKKVLLITIDPAKRLKQILNLDENAEGQIKELSSELFEVNTPIIFHAMLMSPGATLSRIAKEKNLEVEFQTNIIKTLSRPNSGMNEIMSIIEVQYQLEKNFYDTIVLDTPPGKHFIDFLESSEKIKNFFDKSFLEIFEYLGKSVSASAKPKGLFNKLVSTGLNKLLGYLEKVTGTEFVQEFIDSVLALYKSRDSFLKALNFQQDLKQRNFSNWFLVTSIEQQKLSEAKQLNELASKFLHDDNYLIINKCLSDNIRNWSPTRPELIQYKDALIEREDKISSFALKNYQNILKFNEIADNRPLLHVKEIALQFKEYSKE